VGQISLACIPTATFYFLPSVIARFNAEYPNIRFRILDVPASEGLACVARGEVEFGINLVGASDPDLLFEPLLDDPFVLACRRDHPLASRAEVTWSDLFGHALITVSRASGNRILLDAALVKAKIHLSWMYEVTHLTTSLGLVEAGLGISVLPKLATPQTEHPVIVTMPICGPVVSRNIGIVRRRTGSLAPAAQQFLDMLLGAWRTPA